MLRALWGADGEELVRSEVRRRMPHAHRKSLGRVGQILAALYEDGFLIRVQKKAQGSREASFYALSESGKKLCRQLDFQRDEQLLLDAPVELLHAQLSRERLSRLPSTTGQIVTAYSYRGRLGQTTLVAHLARGFAEHLADGRALLAIDLDLQAPGLDALAPQGNVGQSRGLGGLIVDFERLPPNKRALWLRAALKDPRYVISASNDLPNLFYLPNGLGSSHTGLTASERAEALSLLRAEAMAAGRSSRESLEGESLNFFAVLREAIREVFARAVVDSQTRKSLGAWLATQCLADELVLCVDYDDTSKTTITGLQSVLANFLARFTVGTNEGGILFLFRLAEQKKRHHFNRWIAQYLLLAETDALGDPACRVEQLPYNVRLEGPYNEKNTYFYSSIIANLTLGAASSNKPKPPELDMLLTVLDSSADGHARSIAAGALARVPLHGFVRLIEWHEGEGVFPTTTDEEGKELLQGVVETLLISKIIKFSGP